VLDLFRSLEDVVGVESVAKGLASAPPELRQQFEGLTAVSWLPNTTLNALIDAVGKAAGTDPEAMIDVAVRSAIGRALKTVWRMFLRITSDDALIARTPVIFSKARNVGHLTSRICAPGMAEITLAACPDLTPRQMRTFGIGIEEVVRLAGRRDPIVTSMRTADGAVYRLTWRA